MAAGTPMTLVTPRRMRREINFYWGRSTRCTGSWFAKLALGGTRQDHLTIGSSAYDQAFATEVGDHLHAPAQRADVRR
jgi:hypothetical protein